MESAQTEYYTVKTVADMLGVSEETVRRLIRTGALRATPMSSRKQGYQIGMEDLIEFVTDKKNYEALSLLKGEPGSAAGSGKRTGSGGAISMSAAKKVSVIEDMAIQLAEYDTQIVTLEAQLAKYDTQIMTIKAELARLNEERDQFIDAMEKVLREKPGPAGK